MMFLKRNFYLMSSQGALRRSNLARRGSFTLVELLVALMVSSVILGAVAALAYALGRTNDSVDDLGRKQAELRYTTIRLSQLIGYSRLVCGTPGGSLALWRADESDEGKINPAELVYIETGTDCNYIDLVEFEASGAAASRRFSINEIQSGSARTWLTANCTPGCMRLLDQCSNLTFTLDTPAPDTELVNISFEITEDNTQQTYQITAALRGRAANLLDSAGSIVDYDDD
jgi:type II secretory pathway pseudopilin PulG